MNSFHRLWVILSPSLVSGPVTLLAACFIWGSAGWSHITDTQLFYEQLFGPYGVVTLLQIQPYEPGGVQNAILGGSGTYYVLLVLAGVVAGLGIYFILETISRTVSGVSLFWREAHTNREEARQAVRESLARLGLRVAGLVAWAVYLVVFTNVLVPFSILVLQEALDSSDLTNWLIAAATFLGLLASIHMHVTFARLVFLRVRLLGGYDAELSRLESHD